MELRDSVVVVTGASSGIGRAAAWHLSSQGAAVVVTARREDRLTALAKQISDRGGRALPVAADVSDTASLERLRSDAESAFGAVDVLVNNAGIPGGGPFANVSMEQVERVIDVNVLGVMRATKVFLPSFLERKRGHVVNVASLAGRYASPGVSVYGASKHAVVGFSEALFYELQPFGVKVTSVNPGFVSTEGFPNDEIPRQFVMKPERIAEGIARVIERGIAPEYSIPRWLAPFQMFRILTPPLYRAGVKMATAGEVRRHGPPPPLRDGGNG